MQQQINPSGIRGVLRAPASKSVAQRAIAIASLAKGRSEIHYAGHCDDVLAAIEVCRMLGARIEEQKDVLYIDGGIVAPGKALNCGEAGLGIRMFSAISASLSQKVILTGQGSLMKRPMNMIEQSMQAIGVSCTTQDGFAPVTVQGPIPGGNAKVDGSVSSQVLTGILIAAPLALNPLNIEVDDLKSKPYIDITIDTMNSFGVEVINNDYHEFLIKAPQQYNPISYIVEGDWSGAAFLLVAGAIAGEIRVENLKKNSTQADRAILEALARTGAGLEITDNSVTVTKASLRAFTFDATHCPDLFPPLVALAANCHGVSIISGVGRLAVKESNRALTLQEEFARMGIKIKLDGELMYIEGAPLKQSKVHAHHDHRIAMACAIAALVADGPVLIENAEAIAKSYPEFYYDLEAVSLYNG